MSATPTPPPPPDRESASHAPPPYPPPGYAPIRQGNGLAVAALVLGIIGVVFGWIPIIGVISWVIGPLAIIFGVVGRRRAKQGGGLALVKG